MFEQFLPDLSALLQVLLIDIVLAGDNVIVIGAAASSVDKLQRKTVIIVGVSAAVILRIIFASIATQLLEIVGLLFLGGILLSWVCWKMYTDLLRNKSLKTRPSKAAPSPQIEGEVHNGSLFKAVMQILIADISMSLDNVLAVVGAAREHPYILVFGLLFSAILMGTCASFVSNVLVKHRWIALIGLLVIVYVSCSMMWHGGIQIACHYDIYDPLCVI